MNYLVSPHAASATVDGGAVLLHMETKRYYSLNETGALIWRLLQQRVDHGRDQMRVGHPVQRQQRQQKQR